MREDEIPPIESDRLMLVSMSVELLRLMVEGKWEEAQDVSDFLLPADCSLARKGWVERRIRMIEQDPEQHPWMYRAIVRKRDNRMVGYISFHHKAPDPDLLDHSGNGAELGYTIEPSFRRNGYAMESALAMMKWANREHGVESFFLSISPENLPSLMMAEAMGFRIIAEREDEIDGLEYTMKAEIGDLPEAMLPV